MTSHNGLETQKHGSEHHSREITRKSRQKAINNRLILLLCVVTLIAVVALAINTIRVARYGSFTDEITQEVETDTQKNMRNDRYEIGNNPSEIQKEYFQELTDTMKTGSKEEYATALVKCFVSDYFSWRNKDGNYEVGGLQYVYGQKYLNLDNYTKWNYQEDFDLYLQKYGKDQLPLVKSVDLYKVTQVEDFDILTVDPVESLPCYEVKVYISYENSKIKDTEFCDYLTAYVVDNKGRMEIASLFAYNLENRD